MTIRYGWTKRILANFIEAHTYEKYLLNQTNFDATLPEERKTQAKLAVKDEYSFDFAELSPEYSEHELEMQLVSNIRAFLIEMGGDFAFMAISTIYRWDQKTCTLICSYSRDGCEVWLLSN